MSQEALKVLFIEDSQDDLFMLIRELQRGGFKFIYVRVETALELEEALFGDKWDVVISDFLIPGFGGMEALQIVRSRGYDIPFILVSGKVREELAVKAIKAGAQDFVSKDSTGRLCTVIKRELEVFENERERKGALDALRESEKKYRELMEHAYGLIFEIDAAGQIRSSNKAFCDTLGLVDIQSFSIEEFAPELKESVGVVLNGKPVAHVEVKISSMDETPVYLEGNMVPHFEAGRVVGAGCFFRDVRERHLYQAALEQKTQEALQANERLREEILLREQTENQLRLAQKLEAVGQLASGLAHEINTPVQYINDNMAYLKRGFEYITDLFRRTPDLHEAVQEGLLDTTLLEKFEDLYSSRQMQTLLEEMPAAINESLEGLFNVTAIVRSMSEFAHPGTEGKQPVDINRLVETTITLSRNEWKYIADIQLNLDESLPRVPCNKVDIGQSILNLLINAAHAIDDAVAEGKMEKGIIWIHTKATEDLVEIRIEDNGPGVPEEIQSRIFDPFFTTKEVGRGTGQGLALAYSYIVKKHQGTITLESEPGYGAHFIIRLPIMPASVEETTDESDNDG